MSKKINRLPTFFHSIFWKIRCEVCGKVSNLKYENYAFTKSAKYLKLSTYVAEKKNGKFKIL